MMNTTDWKAFHIVQGGVLNNDGVVVHYGDVSTEARALWEGAGVLLWEDRGVLLVRGRDAEGLLHSLASNDIRGLSGLDEVGKAISGKNRGETDKNDENRDVFHTQPNLFCNRYGKPLYEVEVLRLDSEQFLVLTAGGQLSEVAAHLEGFRVREQVEIGQAPLLVLGLSGRESERVLHSWGLSATGGRGEGMPLLAAKDIWWLPPRPPLYWVFMPSEDAEEILATLLSSSVQLAGRAAWEEVRIAVGRPLAGVDYDAANLTAEAGLNTHISATKGCYLGQEVHARLRHRGKLQKRLAAFWLEAPDSSACDSFLWSPQDSSFTNSEQEETPVAQITSLGKLPFEEHIFGLSMVNLKKLTSSKLAVSPQGMPLANFRLL